MKNSIRIDWCKVFKDYLENKFNFCPIRKKIHAVLTKHKFKLVSNISELTNSTLIVQVEKDNKGLPKRLVVCFYDITHPFCKNPEIIQKLIDDNYLYYITCKLKGRSHEKEINVTKWTYILKDKLSGISQSSK